MRKLLAITLVLCLCANAEASDWSSYLKLDWQAVKDYTAEKWDDWFSSKSNDPAPQLSGDTLPPDIASNWGKLTGTLGDTLTLRDKQETLPKKSWLPFREDQQSNASKINALLDKALSILVNGEAGSIRKEASSLRDSINAKKNELDSLRNQRITAPEKSSLPWKLTKSKADDRIARLQEELEDSEERIGAINAKLAAAMKEIGLELDASQTEILLNSVTGDDLMQNTIVFTNVKAVVEKLEELAQNDTNTLEITRRYTGMYLVLNDLLIHTQEELVRKIDGEYKAKLNAIAGEAKALQKEAETRSVQDVYSKEQRKAFAANAQANALTVQAAGLYAELLDSQKAAAMDSIKSLRLNRDLAENTYRTVRSSGELRGLIHTGLKVFDAVGTLKMPELKVFETGAMKAEFEEINRRLRK